MARQWSPFGYAHDHGVTSVEGSIATQWKRHVVAISTEFAETSGVPPSQGWFDDLKASGVDMVVIPLHNLAQNAVNPNLNDYIDKAVAAELFVGLYCRPVGDTLTFYNTLSSTRKSYVLMIALDVEDVGETITLHTEVEAIEAEEKAAWIYTNWGLWGDVMGYSTSGWGDVKLWMRDLYTVPATLASQRPYGMFEPTSGKTFESWPTVMPSDWGKREAVQWADPLDFTGGSAESYDVTYNLFEAEALGFVVDDSVPHHEHVGEGSGGKYFRAATSEFLGNIRSNYSSGSKSLLLGTIDTAHTNGTEGAELAFDWSARKATLVVARFGDRYDDLDVTARNMVFNGGLNGASGQLRLDDTTNVAIRLRNRGYTNYASLQLSADTGTTLVVPNAASDTFVMEAATQTLTNKTLTTPTIASFTNAQHDHSNAAGGGTLAGAAVTTLPAIILPNSQDTGGDGTTSGTTELTVKEITITNPPVAGQILIIATVSLRAGTVAGDNFQVRLYFGTTPTQRSTAIVQTQTDNNGEMAVTLHAVAAVAASGTQLIRTTVQRNAGTGTVIAAAGQCEVSWLIVPGAGTTA